MAYRGRDWNEEDLSESPAARQLEALGYRFVSAETLETERESLKDLVLSKVRCLDFEDSTNNELLVTRQYPVKGAKKHIVSAVGLSRQW